MENNIRFADYFFRAGISPNRELSKINEPDHSDKGNQKDEEPHPLTNRYEPETLYRYPSADYSEHDRYPPYTPMFCFPDDIKFVNSEGLKPQDKYHSFIITESNGTKYYGVCLVTYITPSTQHMTDLKGMISAWRDKHLVYTTDKVESDYEYAHHLQNQLAFEKESLLKYKVTMKHDIQLDSSLASLGDAISAEEKINVLEELMTPLRDSILVIPENIYTPTCIGIISRWPWYTFFKDWLCLLQKSILDRDFDMFPFERFVINIIQEIPFPPPGKLELAVPFGNFLLHCSRPPLNSCPLIKDVTHFNKFTSYPLFRLMCIENIITVIELLLTEYKVIMVSEHPALLTLAAESFMGWMFPFYWHHILIPVLPARLINYLQAPVPYLVGIVKSSFPKWRTEEWKPYDVIFSNQAAIVDIDNDLVDFPPLTVKLPSRERKKLIAGLVKNSGSPINPGKTKLEVPLSVQYAFPRGKINLNSTESILNYRKVRDIPKAMYSTFDNTFLLQKSGNFRLSSSNSTSHDISQGISQSFTSISQDKSKSGDKAELVPVIETTESVTSFRVSTVPQTPSDVQDSETASTSPANMNSFHEAISLTPQIHDNTPTNLNHNSGTTTPSSAKLLNWWNKATPVNSTTFELKQSHSPVKKSPGFLDKMLGLPTNTQSLDSAFSMISIESEKLINREEYKDTRETIIMKDGHVFYHLLLKSSRNAAIDSDESDEEYADRFTTYSDDSDENTNRSDVSTIQDGKSNIFNRKSQRAIGRSYRDIFGRKKVETTRVEKVRKTESHDCLLCQEHLIYKTQSLFMCRECHLTIHEDCLPLTSSSPCPFYFSDEKISLTFFKVFTSIMKKYRTFFKPKLANHTSLDGLQSYGFNQKGFIDDFELDSRAFAQFLLDRIERRETDYEIMVFEESIKQKLNRSKMKFTKEATPFLNENSYQISSTYVTMAPDLTNLPDEKRFAVDPYGWKSEYEIEPRIVRQLLTETDIQMMEAHTLELIQRSKASGLVILIKKKEHHEFSKWIKKLKKNEQQDELRRERLESKLDKISSAIDEYEAAHLSSQTNEQLQKGIDQLIEQNMILMQVTCEENISEFNDEDVVQKIISRLMRVIAAYQEQVMINEKLVQQEESRLSEGNILSDGSSISKQNSDKATRKDNVDLWVSAVPEAIFNKSESDLYSEDRFSFPSIDVSLEYISDTPSLCSTETERNQPTSISKSNIQENNDISNRISDEESGTPKNSEFRPENVELDTELELTPKFQELVVNEFKNQDNSNRQYIIDPSRDPNPTL